MSIFLLILKIIGIVLASILGLILLLLLLILFVPIRYKGRVIKKDEEENNLSALFKVTFLLHFINVRVLFPSDELLRVRVALFKVFPKKKKEDVPEEEKKPADEKPPAEEKPPIEEPPTEAPPEKEEKPEEIKEPEPSDKPEVPDVIEKPEEPEESEDNEDIEDEPRLDKFFKKLTDFFLNIKDRIEAIKAKICDIIDNIEYYKKVLSSKTFERAFDKAKYNIFKIIKYLKPRKIKGYVNYGDPDKPDSVGMMFGAYSVFYPLIGNKLYLNPYFDRKTLEADVLLKGHFNLFTILVIALKAYFDKDIKRVIKLLKREKINGRK